MRIYIGDTIVQFNILPRVPVYISVYAGSPVEQRTTPVGVRARVEGSFEKSRGAGGADKGQIGS